MPKPLKLFVEYFRFIFSWWSGMSSGCSVPLAVLALANVGHPRAIYTIFAFALLLFASGCLVKRILELRVPRLRFACSPDILRCKALSGSRENYAYRVSVINKGRVPVNNCKARLWRITKDSSPVFEGDSPQLTFTPSGGQDALSKTLEFQVQHTLDVLYLHRDSPRKVVLATKIGNVELVWGHRPLQEIFNGNGKYRFYITVSGEPFVHAELVLLLNWTGDYSSSELWLENIEPKEARDPNP